MASVKGSECNTSACSDPLSIGLYVSVAVPRPIFNLFTYKVPMYLASQVTVGSLVRVSFGRSLIHAFVIEGPKPLDLLTAAGGSHSKTLKEIKEVIHLDGECFSKEIWKLCLWAHEYYHCPLGEILDCAAFSASEKLNALKRPPKRTRCIFR